MSNGRSKRNEHGVNPQHAQATAPQAVQSTEQIIIEAERSGDWMPADELQKAALDVLAAGQDATVNLHGIDHLDTSALQVLLAFEAEQTKQGRNLELAHASPHLQQWFEYAGVATHFFHHQAEAL